MIPWMRPMWRMKPIFRIKKQIEAKLLSQCLFAAQAVCVPLSGQQWILFPRLTSTWDSYQADLTILSKPHQYDLCDVHQNQQDGMEQCKRRLWSCSWRSTKCRQHNQPQFSVSVHLRLLHRGQPELRWIVLTHLPVVECCTMYKKSALSAKLAFGN